MFYHCSHSWLEPGSIIRPGNYGRILQETGATHSAWLREQFLELVRIKEYPEKPSRFTCAFVCSCLNSMQLFKKHNCSTGIMYEVELVIPKAKTHTTCFNVIQPLPGVMEDMYEVSKSYWEGSFWPKIEGFPDLKCEEILVESGLRIVKEIQMGTFNSD